MPSGLCIASTVRNTGPRLGSFLEYHLRIGVSRMFLFFDDPRVGGIKVARRFEGVTAIVCDRALRVRQRRNPGFRKFGPFLSAPEETGRVARRRRSGR
jgi:hypothetical protein